VNFDSVQRAVLAGLADVLIPAGDGGQHLIQSATGNAPGARRGHAVSGGDQDVGEAGQHGPLGGIEVHAGTSWLERPRTSWSLQRKARAAMVAVGFMPLEVGQMLPSKMNRLGMSWARPWPLYTLKL